MEGLIKKDRIVLDKNDVFHLHYIQHLKSCNIPVGVDEKMDILKKYVKHVEDVLHLDIKYVKGLHIFDDYYYLDYKVQLFSEEEVFISQLELLN